MMMCVIRIRRGSSLSLMSMMWEALRLTGGSLAALKKTMRDEGAFPLALDNTTQTYPLYCALVGMP
jgi:hypothetical protein